MKKTPKLGVGVGWEVSVDFSRLPKCEDFYFLVSNFEIVGITNCEVCLVNSCRKRYFFGHPQKDSLDVRDTQGK